MNTAGVSPSYASLVFETGKARNVRFFSEQSSMRRHNEFTKALLDTLCTPDRAAPRTPPTLGNTKITGNPASNSVAGILKRPEVLIGDYRRLNKLILDVQDARPEGVAEGWADDLEQAARLPEIGSEAAIRNVEEMLGADVDDDGVEGAGEEGEKIGTVEDVVLNYGSRESLQFAERGMRDTVKNVPYDEEV